MYTKVVFHCPSLCSVTPVAYSSAKESSTRKKKLGHCEGFARMSSESSHSLCVMKKRSWSAMIRHCPARHFSASPERP